MKPEKLLRVQALRGFAALSVVFCHYAGVIYLYDPRIAWINISQLGPLGVTGVDIFFVLSGFIMSHTTQYLEPSKAHARWFLTQRVKRIYPLYWFWSLVLLAIWAAGIGLQHQHPSFDFIRRSFALLPAMQPSGKWEPWLGPGWTLTYEMYFYLIFSATLLWVPPRFRSLTIAGTISALFVIGRAWPGSPSFTHLAGSTLVFEFLMGIGIAHLYRQLCNYRKPLIGLSLIALALTGFAISTNFNAMPIRAFWYGIPAALLLLGVLQFGEINWTKARTLLFWGDASYTIYLSHPFGLIVLGTLLKHGKGTYINPDLLIIACTTVTMFACSQVYRYTEQPLMQLLRRRRSSSDAKSPAAVTTASS